MATFFQNLPRARRPVQRCGCFPDVARGAYATSNVQSTYSDVDDSHGSGQQETTNALRRQRTVRRDGPLGPRGLPASLFRIYAGRSALQRVLVHGPGKGGRAQWPVGRTVQ